MEVQTKASQRLAVYLLDLAPLGLAPSKQARLCRDKACVPKRAAKAVFMKYTLQKQTCSSMASGEICSADFQLQLSGDGMCKGGVI